MVAINLAAFTQGFRQGEADAQRAASTEQMRRLRELQIEQARQQTINLPERQAIQMRLLQQAADRGDLTNARAQRTDQLHVMQTEDVGRLMQAQRQLALLERNYAMDDRGTVLPIGQRIQRMAANPDVIADPYMNRAFKDYVAKNLPTILPASGYTDAVNTLKAAGIIDPTDDPNDKEVNARIHALIAGYNPWKIPVEQAIAQEKTNRDLGARQQLLREGARYTNERLATTLNAQDSRLNAQLRSQEARAAAVNDARTRAAALKAGIVLPSPTVEGLAGQLTAGEPTPWSAYGMSGDQIRTNRLRLPTPGEPIADPLTDPLADPTQEADPTYDVWY